MRYFSKDHFIGAFSLGLAFAISETLRSGGESDHGDYIAALIVGAALGLIAGFVGPIVERWREARLRRAQARRLE